MAYFEKFVAVEWTPSLMVKEKHYRRKGVPPMKKIRIFTVCSLLLLTLGACRSGGSGSALDTSESVESTEAQNETSNSNILVVYFTVPESVGEDTVAGASRVSVDGEVVGNTQLLANWIADETGADLHAIETVEAYPGNHDVLVDQADAEQEDAARPELSSSIENLDAYDTIFLGYPNWWGDMPMPLYTFLETYDFAGKTIIPFNSHGGSSLSGTVSTIASIQPDANVSEDALTIARNDVANSQQQVLDWVARVH